MKIEVLCRKCGDVLPAVDSYISGTGDTIIIGVNNCKAFQLIVASFLLQDVKKLLEAMR